MFKLTKEHIVALEAAASKQADRNLTVYARRRFPDHLGRWPDAEVHSLVRNARSVGSAHGFEHEHDIAILLDLGVMYGAGFDQQGWPSEVLAKRDLPAAERAALLRQRLIAMQTKSPDAPRDDPAPQAMPKVAPAPPLVFAAVSDAPAQRRARSPLPPGPPQTGGQRATLDDAIKNRDAAVETIAKLPAQQRNKVAAVCAAINTATGQVAIGFKIHGESFGKSAEELAVEHIGGNAPTVKLTAPIDPRSKAVLLVSKRSRKLFTAEQFADGTAFEE